MCPVQTISRKGLTSLVRNPQRLYAKFHKNVIDCRLFLLEKI
jgi:hypothetical protein